MCDQYEEENVFEADFIFGRQSSPSPDHEKGPCDQKFPVQVSQVGHTNDRTHGRPTSEGTASARSGWFDDETKEIGHAPSRSQFEFGWVYRRTQTGHIRERTGHRDSVS